MPNIKVQDIRDLNIRTLSIQLALTLMAQKYNLLHDDDNNTLNEDTFIAIMPTVYTNYKPSEHNDNNDVANLHDFND